MKKHFSPSQTSKLLATALVTATAALGARADSILINNAIIHTVSGGTLTNGSVLIKDGKIAAVGDHLSAEGASVVDLQGQHLYPGMIALDSGLGLTEIESIRATIDTTEVGEFHPEIESWVAVNPDSELIPVTRANGITHAEPAPQGGVVGGVSGVVALDGWTVDQMTIKKPSALHVYWPDADLNLMTREGRGGGGGMPGGGRRGRGGAGGDSGGPKSADEQARDRENKIKEIDEFFQEAKVYAKARAVGKAQLNPPWEAMLPVLRGDIPIMVHADDQRQIKSALKWAKTNDFKIVIVGGQDAWQVADLLAAQKTPVIFEHVFTLPRQESAPYDLYFKAPEVLRKAGVKVSFSMGASGMNAAHGRNLPYGAAQAVAFGMPEDEAIKSLTLFPAELVGVSDRMGSIEAGKDASLFVSDGSILDEKSSVKRMWIAGKEVSLTSKHTKLFDKYKGRPMPAPPTTTEVKP